MDMIPPPPHMTVGLAVPAQGANASEDESATTARTTAIGTRPTRDIAVGLCNLVAADRVAAHALMGEREGEVGFASLIRHIQGTRTW